MPRKRHTAEETIGKLREVEIRVAQGVCAVDAIRGIGVTEQTARSSQPPTCEPYLPFSSTSVDSDDETDTASMSCVLFRLIYISLKHVYIFRMIRSTN